MKKKTKKIFLGLLLVSQILSFRVWVAADETLSFEKRKLLVTAYYSPLPNQEFYIRGSYAADVILNGRGVRGADGTPVFIGMLAAPKTYPFGTTVTLPGLGTGVVHDRGGAILAKKDYDRIDVWMGYGEEGLSRALNWGARLVEGEVNFSARQGASTLNFDWVSPKLPQTFVNRLKAKSVADISPVQESKPIVAAPVPVAPAPDVIEPTDEPTEEDLEVKRLQENRALLVADLGKDATGDEVKNLQRMLWEVGYYKGEIHGIYDQATMDAVFELQLKNGILKSSAENGAGYFGKKTLNALLAALENKISVISTIPVDVQVWQPAPVFLPQIASLSLPELSFERQSLQFGLNKKVVQEVVLTAEIGPDEQGENVKKLQEFLISHGYLEKALATGYYGEKTKAAVLSFQLENGIIKSQIDPGAGRVGPQTLSALNSK